MYNESPTGYRLVQLKKEIRQQYALYLANQEWRYSEDGERRWRYFSIELSQEDWKEFLEDSMPIKEWVLEKLWKCHADTRAQTSQYDCTGLWFTSGYKVVHVYGLTFKAVEWQNLDI